MPTSVQLPRSPLHSPSGGASHQDAPHGVDGGGGCPAVECGGGAFLASGSSEEHQADLACLPPSGSCSFLYCCSGFTFFVSTCFFSVHIVIHVDDFLKFSPAGCSSCFHSGSDAAYDMCCHLDGGETLVFPLLCTHSCIMMAPIMFKARFSTASSKLLLPHSPSST